MPDHYSADAYCRNCAYEGPVEAPVGEPIYKQACPLCGCGFLSAVANRDWNRPPQSSPSE